MRQLLLTAGIILLGAMPVSAQLSQSEFAAEVIRRMDRNRDGRLQPNEIPLRSRRGVQKLATAAGLDSEEPLPVDRLLKQLRQQDKRGTKNKQNKPQQPGSASPGSGGTSTATSEQPVAKKPAPGFRGEIASPRVSGFSDSSSRISKAPNATRSNVSETADDRSSFKKAGGKDVKKGVGNNSFKEAASEKDEAKEKNKESLRWYAAGMLKQHDSNKDGVLESNEWKQMRGNPEQSDKNQDGKLTVDELAVHLSNFPKGGNPRKDGPKDRPKGNKTAKRPSRKSKYGSRKSYRFLSPTERLSETLPKSLRDWFLRNDKDGDGQIAMSEFASFWSQDKAIEFARYDQNNDGLITAQEYVGSKSSN